MLVLLLACEATDDAGGKPDVDTGADTSRDTNPDSDAEPYAAVAYVGGGGTLLVAAAPLEEGHRWSGTDSLQTIDAQRAFTTEAGPYQLLDERGEVIGVATEVEVTLGSEAEHVLVDAGERGSLAIWATGATSELALVSRGVELAAVESERGLEGALVLAGSAETQLLLAPWQLSPPGRPDLVVAASVLRVVHSGVHAFWGDLHSHSNLSKDGCEDDAADCVSRGITPALDVFEQAAANDLDFFAMTEHAEYSAWVDLTTGVEVDIVAEVLRLTAEAEGGPVLPIIGYEWTGAYTEGGHRTVLFDRLDVCADRFIQGQDSQDALERANGVERFDRAETPLEKYPAALLARLADPEPCEVDSLSYFHHPAYDPPQSVDWSYSGNQSLGDRVVEIYSEHGSSECKSLTAPGCAFGALEERYNELGSVQSALELGLDLGFVGGSDNHDGRPGSLTDGPSGVYGVGEYSEHTTAGAITLAWLPGQTLLDRPALFSAIRARHSGAVTFRPEAVGAALVCGETVWLPGDDVPPGDCLILARLQDPNVTYAEVDVIDRAGAASVHVLSAEGTLAALAVLAAGDALYLRFRPQLTDGSEQRVWLSPWFATE